MFTFNHVSCVICHMSHVTCHMSSVTCLMSQFLINCFFFTKLWSQSVEGLLSTGPTPSSFFWYAHSNQTRTELANVIHEPAVQREPITNAGSNNSNILGFNNMNTTWCRSLSILGTEEKKKEEEIIGQEFKQRKKYSGFYSKVIQCVF